MLIDLARPNFAKTKRGASGGFLPRPLLLRLRHPNSEKKNQSKFCGILSPENCFRKTSSALFQISSSGLLSKKVRILSRAYRTTKTKTVPMYCFCFVSLHRGEDIRTERVWRSEATNTSKRG